MAYEDGTLILYGWALWDYPPQQIAQIGRNGADYIALMMERNRAKGKPK